MRMLLGSYGGLRVGGIPRRRPLRTIGRAADQLCDVPCRRNTDAVARLTADFCKRRSDGATVGVENHAGARRHCRTRWSQRQRPMVIRFVCAVLVRSTDCARNRAATLRSAQGSCADQPRQHESTHAAGPSSVKANSSRNSWRLARAEPGRLNYSSAGHRRADILFFPQTIQTKTGTQITHVAYRRGAQATML